MPDTGEIVIVGAGLAGIAAAYHLAARRAARRVVLIDEREPLTLTSDKGTQAYRNWWPGPDATMLRYMTRSIDLLEEMADESPALVEATPRKALPGPRDKKDRPKPSGTVPSVPRRKDD